MKASYTNCKKGEGNPNHNDRHINLKSAPHIDQKRMHLNSYWHIYQNSDPGLSFEKAEHVFYREIFKDYRKACNKKARETRHGERVKTVESMLRNPRTCPEETIIQIGNVYEQPDPNDPKYRADLLDIMKKMQQYSNEITNGHCRILNVALHMDESTPHIHYRKVWVYNEDGMTQIGAEKALQHAGVPLPNPEIPVSSSNSRKMTYDRLMRDRLYSLCREKGLEIDEEPDTTHTVHLSKKDYIASQTEREQQIELIRKAREKTKKVRYHGQEGREETPGNP